MGRVGVTTTQLQVLARGAVLNPTATNTTCRVMLVDDHTLFRETLAVGLRQIKELEIVAHAGSSAECLASLAETEVDVLMLDLSLPGRGGADLVAQINRRYPNTKILILSAHPADQFVVRLIQQGAAGYLHKSCSLSEVVDGVLRVHSGRMVLGDDLAELIARTNQGDLDGPQPHEKLSNREYQVMERLVSGAGVSEIAEEMHLSVKTISTYRKRLLEKLGVQSNSEVVSYAIRNGLVDV